MSARVARTTGRVTTWAWPSWLCTGCWRSAEGKGRPRSGGLRETPAQRVERTVQFFESTNGMNSSLPSKTAEDVRKAVRAGYGQIARSGGSCCGSTPSSCGSNPVASEHLAKHIGYSPEELDRKSTRLNSSHLGLS